MRREQPKATVRFTPETFAALKRLAETDRRSMQVLIERAVENYLAARKATTGSAA